MGLRIKEYYVLLYIVTVHCDKAKLIQPKEEWKKGNKILSLKFPQKNKLTSFGWNSIT